MQVYVKKRARSVDSDDKSDKGEGNDRKLCNVRLSCHTYGAGLNRSSFTWIGKYYHKHIFCQIIYCIRLNRLDNQGSAVILCIPRPADV